MKFYYRLAVVLGACLTSLNLAAHEGHDHAEQTPPPAPAAAAEPRATTHSELYELVVSREGKQLRLWLDGYADNAPVANARIEVESGAWRAVAQPDSDGSYRVAADGLPAAASVPLTLTITGGRGDDLLETTLGSASGAAAQPASGGGSNALTQRAWLLLIGGLLLGLLPVGLWRLRR